MPIKREIALIGEHLLLTATGNYENTAEIKEKMDDLAGIADSFNVYTIIIDFSYVKGEMTALEKFEMGEYAARLWGFRLKVALIYRAGENTGMFENVAVNRGGNIRVVSSMQEAIEWLEMK